MFRVFCVLIGYCFGIIQTAFIVGKVAGKIDIREHGSGNAGMTNITRVMGKKAGALVFFSDILKAVAACTVCALIFGGTLSFTTQTGVNGVLPVMYAGLGTVLGHNFPFYLQFRGGKGIASTVGLIMALDWRVIVVCYVAALTLIAITRRVSVGSLALVVLLPVMAIILNFGFEAVVLGFAVAILAFIAHRNNITRLLNGTERKF